MKWWCNLFRGPGWLGCQRLTWQGGPGRYLPRPLARHTITPHLRVIGSNGGPIFWNGREEIVAEGVAPQGHTDNLLATEDRAHHILVAGLVKRLLLGPPGTPLFHNWSKRRRGEAKWLGEVCAFFGFAHCFDFFCCVFPCLSTFYPKSMRYLTTKLVSPEKEATWRLVKRLSAYGSTLRFILILWCNNRLFN